MLFAIVFVFAVGWCLHFFLPVLFFRFRTKVCRLVFPAFFLGHVTSAVNPCIYLVYIENYRRGFREILNLLYMRCIAIAIRSSRSRVSPLYGSTVVRGGSKSNNASLTLATFDSERTAVASTLNVLSSKNC